MLEAIIFDMDGLMIDTEKVWTTVWPVACDHFGLPFTVEIDDACRGTSGETFVRTVEDYYAGRITDVQAIGQLRFAQPTHQMCIRSQEVVDRCLHFVSSEPLARKGGQP